MLFMFIGVFDYKNLVLFVFERIYYLWFTVKKEGTLLRKKTAVFDDL